MPDTYIYKYKCVCIICIRGAAAAALSARENARLLPDLPVLPLLREGCVPQIASWISVAAQHRAYLCLVALLC
jgi:hypothetical protein